MSVYYRKKQFRSALYAIPALLILVIFCFYLSLGNKFNYPHIFLALMISVALIVGSIKKIKRARIEIHPDKIKYVNVKSNESPPSGEIIISKIESIRKSDKYTIDITTKGGATHYLRIAGVTADDQMHLESELMRFSPYDNLYCFACQTPMNEKEQKCSNCGWTFIKKAGDFI